ncbi:hypothetical protein M6B38_355700 [Iris pallida]|uniref:Secreted protein n=1 Tax=Iris pallida TaxID=29817 RepID=A0AAX6GMQ9_IRIPA|nr:hypothetical protein M6B38_355695 [Iris pallida]KAJ6829803.1 hypothetical protein M6B38_355700 [Iris pallida]
MHWLILIFRAKLWDVTTRSCHTRFVLQYYRGSASSLSLAYTCVVTMRPCLVFRGRAQQLNVTSHNLPYGPFRLNS